MGSIKDKFFMFLAFIILSMVTGLVGLFVGWLSGNIVPFTVCGVLAGMAGALTFRHWHRIFNRDLSFIWCGVIMILACALLGGNIVVALGSTLFGLSISGLQMLGVGLGIMFGGIVVGVTALIARLSGNVQ